MKTQSQSQTQPGSKLLIQSLTLTLLTLLLGPKPTYLVLTLLLTTWTLNKLTLYKSVLDKRVAARGEQARQQRLRDIYVISAQISRQIINVISTAGQEGDGEGGILEALRRQQRDIADVAVSSVWEGVVEDYYQREREGERRGDSTFLGSSLCGGHSPGRPQGQGYPQRNIQRQVHGQGRGQTNETLNIHNNHNHNLRNHSYLNHYNANNNNYSQNNHNHPQHYLFTNPSPPASPKFEFPPKVVVVAPTSPPRTTTPIPTKNYT